MACAAAVREVAKRTRHVRIEVMTDDGLHVLARRLFRQIHWWTFETINEAVMAEKRRRDFEQNR